MRTTGLFSSSRGAGRLLAAGFALVSLASCAENAPAPQDATVGVDLPSDIIAVADRGPSTKDVAGPSDARADVGVDVSNDARDVTADVPADAGTRLEVPVDPMGVPAPGSECTGDAGVRGGDPTIAPPRPILPQSVSRVTSQRPSFRWALPEGTTGARVEVCADRCCARVLQTLNADGTAVRLTTALPPGVVYWRMFGRAGGATGSRASYTWEFEVRRRDTPVDSSWGTIRDFTGDGYDDLLMLSGEYNPDRTRTFYVVEGGSSGPSAPRAYAAVTQVPIGRAHVGDFNGDGRVDLGYQGIGAGSESRTINALESNPRGMPRVVRMSTFSIPGVEVDQEGVRLPTRLSKPS